MKEIIVRDCHGLAVGQQQTDGYVNITRLAKAYQQKTNKRRDTHKWLKSKRIQESINHLSTVTQIRATELVKVFKGGEPHEQGTFIHPRLATRFAMWLSDEFGLMVEDWVEDWRNGDRELKPEKPLSSAELLVKQAQALLEHEQRLDKHDEEIDYLGNLYNLVAHNINVTNQSRLDVLMQVHESDLLADEDPSPVPLRKQVWKLVNKFSLAANILPENAWNYFYKELKDRYGFDAKARRKNRGLKFALDAVEQEPRMLENLHKIVSSEFKKLDLPKPQKVEDISNLSYIGQEQDLVLISPSEAKVGDSYDGKNFYRSPDKISK